MAKSEVDWEVVEREYRAGIASLRQIAESHGISEGAIRKRAKRDGWERDLSQKISQKADALVRKEAVRSEVRTESTVSEREIIDANARAVVSVRLAHRQDIARGRDIVTSMFEELRMQCGPENADLLEQLGDMMRAPDEHGQDKLNDLYHKIISLPGRAKTMKDLTDSLTKLIDKERQAFGIDKDTPEGDSGPALTDAQRASRIAALLAKAREASGNGS